jgi:hypothetical protein
MRVNAEIGTNRKKEEGKDVINIILDTLKVKCW